VPGEDYGWEAFIASVDGLAMGRGTYDHVADVQPWPFADKKVFVFTHRPPQPRTGVTFWSRTPAEALAEWTEVGLRRVYVDGGVLIGQFLGENLIDDLTITMAPILLGQGVPLFQSNGGAGRLELRQAVPFPSGMITIEYRRAS